MDTCLPACVPAQGQPRGLILGRQLAGDEEGASGVIKFPVSFPGGVLSLLSLLGLRPKTTEEKPSVSYSTLEKVGLD